MDRIARLTRSDLERKLRDARQALREIASASEDGGHRAGFSRFATWALELIFEERWASETAVESSPAVPPLEGIPLHAGIAADGVDAGPSLAEPVPFPGRDRRPVRSLRDRGSEELLRRVRG